MMANKPENYYDNITSGYEELHKEEQEKKLAIIKKALQGKIKKSSRLLDVGCGTGITSDFDCVVFGADPAMKLLQRSVSKPMKKPDFPVCAEAEHLPFKDWIFDVVISVTALQNFHDVGKGLDEMKRVGKKDCVFALSFLKRSGKKWVILKEIKERFEIKDEVEEEKDIILICK